MINPGAPSITVPIMSRMTLTSSMKLTGPVAMDWIHSATSCGTLAKTSTQDSTPAAATRKQHDAGIDARPPACAGQRDQLELAGPEPPTSTEASAPTAADSVGLARPVRMEPTMTMGISSVGAQAHRGADALAQGEAVTARGSCRHSP